MGLSVDDLLRRIGADNVSVQFLDECLTGATKRKSGLTEVKFLTDRTDVGAFMRDDPTTIGMVVWMPYRAFRNAQDAYKAENELAGRKDTSPAKAK